MKTPLKIEEEWAFSTEQMRAARNVENNAVTSIGCDERRVTVAPFDELRQSIASNRRAEKTEKTPRHLILPVPRALFARPID